VRDTAVIAGAAPSGP